MISKKKLTWLVIILLGILTIKFFANLRTGSPGEGSFIIRVRLVYNKSSITLSSRGSKVTDAKTQQIYFKRLKLRKGSIVLAEKEGIRLDEKEITSKSIFIAPDKGRFLELNGKTYRGKIKLIKTDRGLTVINFVGLEDYLKGVVPKEVNHLWPSAALRAQAIVSRSFAVYKAQKRKNFLYDLTGDTYSQVYGGKSSERWRTDRAVQKTRGEVLAYKGKVLPAYFHSSCGGYTQNISRMWGESTLRENIEYSKGPLKSVRCRWCRISPHFRWQVRVAPEVILEDLTRCGYQIENIKDVRAGTRDDSGRLEYVRIKSSSKWLEVDTEEFADALGRRVIRSNNFRVKRYPHFYLFSGYGWGHGVGLCQWGAFAQAIRFRSTKKILQFYYPGSEIVQLKEIVAI